MTRRTSFLTRCLSMFLVLVLLLSNVNMGFVVRASAAEVKLGDAIADNYGLINEARGLLTGSYLKGADDPIAIMGFNSDGLVTVDSVNKTVTAKDYKTNWKPVSVVLKAEGQADETITLTNGTGTYASTAEAFSVEASYAYLVTNPHEALLHAGNSIQSAMQEIKTVAATVDLDRMGSIEGALDSLVAVAEGKVGTLSFKEPVKASILALNNSLVNGKLPLSQLTIAYNQAASKVKFLMDNADTYLTAYQTTYQNLKVLHGDTTGVMGEMLPSIVGIVYGPAAESAVVAFQDALGAQVDAMAAMETTVSNAKWATQVSVVRTDLTEAQYIAVDTLAPNAVVNAAVKESLTVAKADPIVVAMDMQTVEISVTVKTTSGVADDATLVPMPTKNVTVTLKKGAENALSAVEAKVEDILKNELKVIPENFTVATLQNTIPEGQLTVDAEYTVIYEPVKYNVTEGYIDGNQAYHGYILTLPSHSDETKSYDYTVEIGGEKYENLVQGNTITITGGTKIDRTSGKARYTIDIYDTIGEFSGNAIAEKILKTDALFADQKISVRRPDPSADPDMIRFDGSTVTAQAEYPASLNDLKWIPYDFGNDTNKTRFNGNTGSYTGDSVTVRYGLNLSSYVSAQEYVSIMTTVKQVYDQSVDQTKAIDALKQIAGSMENFNSSIVRGALLSAVDATKFSEDTAENAAVKQRFTEALSTLNSKYPDNDAGGVSANTGNMVLYDLMQNVNDLMGYYKYDDELIKAIANLSAVLDKLFQGENGQANVQALVKTLKDDPTVGSSVPGNIDAILQTLKQDVDELKTKMHAKHQAIDLENPNLGKMISAMQESTGTITVPAGTDVYAMSPDFTVAKEGKVQVVIDVYEGGSYNVETGSIEDGKYIGSYKTGTADKENLPADLTDVIAKAKAAMDKDLYKLTHVYGADPETLIDADMQTSKKAFYVFEPKTFTVKIGEATYTVGLGTTMTVELPATGKEPYFYNEFTINGKTYMGGESVTFTEKDLKNAELFVNGACTLTYQTINRNEHAMSDAFDNCTTIKPVRENGVTTALVATFDGSGKDGIMAFAKDLITNGEFDYVALNGKVIMLKDGGEDKISVQALIDALLSDPTFGSEKIIALSDNNGGVMLQNSTITLGVYKNAKARTGVEVYFNELPFTLKLTGVPAKMADVAKGLKSVRSYFSFTGNAGEMDVQLNIPNQLYGAYVAALVASNDLDKTNMAEMDKLIAYQFLNDYVFSLLKDPSITAETYANTINRVIKQGNNLAGTGYNEINAKSFEKYYNIIHKLFLDENVEISTAPGVTDGAAADYSVNVKAAGKSVISMLEGFGLDLSLFADTIMEQQEGKQLRVNANINLQNLDTNYQAMVIDVSGTGAAQKYDFTSNLPARVNQITGAAAIVLTGDVTGNLNFQGTTILDLNGHTITGSVNANGKLYLIDSTMDINSVGGVTGNVTGNVTILGGKYSADVTSFLKDGFIQKDGKVMNSLYHFENGSIALHPRLFDPSQFGGKADYITSAKYMAVDLAIDIALNYYTAASLSADKNVLAEYAFTDILGMLTQDTKAGTVGAIVDRVLDCIKLDGGVDTFTNKVLADLLNVQNIYDCTYGENGKSVGPFATYEIGITDYKVDVYHQTSGDYITADLVRDDASYRAKNLSMSLATGWIPEQYADNFKQAMKWLAATVVEGKGETSIEIDLNDITRDGKTISLGGGINTSVALDFSHDVHPYIPGESVDPSFYNKMLATMLAYGSDEVKAELEKNGLLRDLNAAMFHVLDKMTVGTFFTALEKAINSDVTIQQMVDKTGIDMDAANIQKMQNAYDKVKATIGKVLTKYDFTSIAKQPMAKYNDGSYTFTFSADMKDHSVDAYRKGYGVNVDLKSSSATLKLILADDYRIVFDTANASEDVKNSLTTELRINDVDVTGDLEGGTIWMKEAPTTNFAVSYTYYENAGMTTYQHMYVWKLTRDTVNAKLYHAERVAALDDVLKFNGASVWMGPDQVGLALAYNAITQDQIMAFENELGYQVALEKEGYGTVLGSWNEDMIPVLNLTDTSHYRYRDEYTDVNGKAYCGNHIRELGMDYVDKTINGRFFIRLEKLDDQGNVIENAETVLYSGLVTRSMYFVAAQNSDVTFGDPYDGYIDNILNYVESNKG